MTVRPTRPKLRLLLEQFTDTLFFFFLLGLLATRRMEGFEGRGEAAVELRVDGFHLRAAPKSLKGKGKD